MDNLALLSARIDALLEKQRRVLIAMDGMAASGKTTLARNLSARYASCAVVHMDDFTVPLDSRTPGYFERTLSNADIDRFDREVLTPLCQDMAACYAPYVCHPEPGFLPSVTIPSDTRLVIVEGAYCLHPQLFDRYDLRVLYTIGEAMQRERVLRRSGSSQLERFVSLWIPMENAHIAAHRLHQRCDLILSADQAS